MTKRKILIIAAVAIVVLVALFIFLRSRQTSSAAASKYETVAVKRDTLTAIVGATGTVEANQTTQLAWQTSGRIGKLNIAVGDQVSSAQVLAELAKNSLSQAVILAEADLVTAQRNLDTLKVSGAAKAQAQLTLAQSEKALTDAEDKRNQKNYQRASQATLDSARANYILAQQSVDNAEEAFSVVSSWGEDDPGRAAVLSTLSTAKQNRDRTLASLNWLLSKPNANEIAQADAELELAKAKLADARREWERIKNGADSEDIAAAQARVAAIQATLTLSNLSAPFGGTITGLNSKVGDQVSPGTVSFRIDDLSRLLVDVEIPEVDINRVQPGKPVEVTFDAIQERQYNGKVEEVARVGTPNPAGGVNFIVTIELTDANETVLPGMTAAVNIIVNQLDNVLLAPNRGIRLDGDKRVVYILRPGVTEPEKVEIKIGSSSDLYSEIASGEVKEGDLLVLNPPVANERGGPPMGN
jgi:HlyD family secretion protein